MPANTKTTRTQAVNSMLSAAGEAPVANLSANGGVDSEMAEAILDETGRSIQAVGWHFNTRKITINPTGGELFVPDAVIRIDPNDLRVTNYAIRGNRVMNLKDGTFDQFTSNLEIEAVELLVWEDMPEAARQYVLKKAARIYVDRTVGDPAASRAVRQDEAEALFTLQREEMTTGNYRVFNSEQAAIVDRGAPLDWIL